MFWSWEFGKAESWARVVFTKKFVDAQCLRSQLMQNPYWMLERAEHQPKVFTCLRLSVSFSQTRKLKYRGITCLTQEVGAPAFGLRQSRIHAFNCNPRPKRLGWSRLVKPPKLFWVSKVLLLHFPRRYPSPGLQTLRYQMLSITPTGSRDLSF